MRIDDIKFYIGLDSWHLTKGTRLTGERNHYKRFEFTDEQWQPLEAGIPFNWNFPNPVNTKLMIAVPLTEIVTVSRHVVVKNIKTYISKNSIDEIKTIQYRNRNLLIRKTGLPNNFVCRLLQREKKQAEP